MRVGLFVPCLVDQCFPETARSTRRVLERIGARVDVPGEPVCCGQLLFKAGLWRKTVPAAKRMIRVFERFDRVVAPSGSCVHMVRRHYPTLFQEDPVWRDPSLELSRKIFELSEFLVHQSGVEDVGAFFPGRVTYHDSCQVLRGLGVREEPRRLLARVRGLELVEMDPPDTCCGFGGVFSFKFPDAAGALALAKAERILATGAGTVTGCEPSCLMNIEGVLRRAGHGVKAFHLADILAGSTAGSRPQSNHGTP
ncbi:MAG: (Fe-S)-binding protein [Deltaproteobacteria bacterium]|nr:(Fe-S)-binding protein [Deltaproteobacteria bacterium]